MAHSWKVVVKSNELLAQAILGVLPQQYLCTIKQCRVAWVGSNENIQNNRYIIDIKLAITLIYCQLYITFALAMMNDNYSIKQCILDYAQNHEQFGINQLVTELGIKINTARQYLCALAKENKVMRIGNGKYMFFTDKQVLKFIPTQELEKLYRELKWALPYTDFCIYDGSIFIPFQHHVSVNHAIYVETNRDVVDTVFARLKDSQTFVYKQPSSAFMYDYVNLQEQCVIVKPFVTESPINEVNGVIVPTLEKLLVDIQKDDDFDYMRGTETSYIYQTAFDQYAVNVPKLFRYAKRRGAYESIHSLIKQLQLI